MADEPPQKKDWAVQTPRREPRTRVLLSDRMVVFATSGTRDTLFPSRGQLDGFDVLNHHIYAVSPRDLRPENHEKLKALLAAKITEAKEFPFSKNETERMKEQFLDSVIIETLYEFPVPAIRYFAKYDQDFSAEYNVPAHLQQITAAKAKDLFSPYALISQIKGIAGDDDAKLYLSLKKMFAENGRQDEFARIERQVAEKHMRFKLKDLSLPEADSDKIVRESIIVKTDEQGKQHVVISTVPLKALQQRLIEKSYSDLDTVINDARQHIADKAKATGITNPFGYTEAEKEKIKEIDQIAHKNIRCKPVMLAGYSDPNLTIIVNKDSMVTREGVSYGSMNLIEVHEKPKQGSFADTMTEELLHQGVDKIYRNNSLPYRNNHDSRKALLERAIATDVKDVNRLGMLGLSKITNYNMKSSVTLHQEIPVKVLKYMDDEHWSAIKTVLGNQAFNHIATFANEVIVKDAIAYNQKQQLPDIGNDYSRSLSHTAQINQPHTDRQKH